MTNNTKIKLPSNRSFGIVFFIVFLLVSLYPLINDKDIRVWSFILSLLFLLLGIKNSNILTPFNIMWLKFGLLLGKIVSPIIMGVVFFLGWSFYFFYYLFNWFYYLWFGFYINLFRFSNACLGS